MWGELWEDDDNTADLQTELLLGSGMVFEQQPVVSSEDIVGMLVLEDGAVVAAEEILDHGVVVRDHVLRCKVRVPEANATSSADPCGSAVSHAAEILGVAAEQVEVGEAAHVVDGVAAAGQDAVVDAEGDVAAVDEIGVPSTMAPPLPCDVDEPYEEPEPVPLTSRQRRKKARDRNRASREPEPEP